MSSKKRNGKMKKEKSSELKKEYTGKRWSKREDDALKAAVSAMGPKNWKQISLIVPGRSDVQCLHRWQKVLRPGLIKGPWTKEEDSTVKRCIEKGITKWSEIATYVPGRIGKQCRERWFNHLDPSIKKGGWTKAEDEILFKAQSEHGNKWSFIASLLPGRTENAVKNRWNGTKRKRLQGNEDKQLSKSDKKNSISSPKKRKRPSLGTQTAEVADFMATLTTMKIKSKKKTESSTQKKRIKIEKISTKPCDRDLAATILLFSEQSRSTISPVYHQKVSQNTILSAPLSRCIAPNAQLKV